MKYVYVAGLFSSETIDSKIDKNIYQYVNQNQLLSLINGLKQKNFGLDTINKIKTSIHKHKNLMGNDPNNKLFIDSGGYSIIVGDVHPTNLVKFIDCYSNYLETEYKNYNYIFSLDIPISLKYSNLNTKTNIYNLNKLSLSKSKEILENNPELLDKFYFVWHFKIKDQYDIWKQIYDELNLNDLILNRSIGGLVGLKGLTGISFTPFIGMLFRLFKDYILSAKFDKQLRIHVLGISSKSDRLTIAIIENLFNMLLKEYNSSCLITYDSIRYKKEMMQNAKNSNANYFNIENKELVCYNGISNKMNFIKEIYGNELLDIILEDIEILKTNDSVTSSSLFVPVNVYSNMQLDSFFELITDKYELAYQITKKSHIQYTYFLTSILKTLSYKYPQAFTQQLSETIKTNMLYIYSFYNYYKNNKNLDELIYKVIENIKFPFSLS